MSYCNGNAIDAVLEDNEVRVLLQQGTIGLLIEPDQDRQRSLMIRTPSADVRSEGALFTAHVDDQGTQLEVYRGSLEVVPDGNKTLTFNLVEGRGAVVRQQKISKLYKPQNSILIDTILANHVDVFEKNVDIVQESVSSSSGLEEATDYDDDDAAPDGETIDGFIENAQTCMLARDWYCAALQYEKVLKECSSGPESSPVLISLAKIEFRQLNLPKTALAHYRLYLKRAPNGPLVQEALLGSADVHRSLGTTEDEKAALEVFVERFPDSTLISTVRERLRQLEDAQLY